MLDSLLQVGRWSNRSLYTKSQNIILLKFKIIRWRSGGVRALASNQCGPGSITARYHKCHKLSFLLIFALFRGFFSSISDLEREYVCWLFLFPVPSPVSFAKFRHT